MLTLAFNIQAVNAAGTIYIRADGSIDPQTAPISTIDNVTYVFTGNINDSVVVERDNIVIDGSGYTLFGIWFHSRGIDLTGRSNITIHDINIIAFEYGIYLYSSTNMNISRNKLTGNFATAICINSSSNNNANGNILTNNFIGIFLESSSSNNIASENNIAGAAKESESASFFYGIEIVSSSNNTLIKNKIANNDDGIDLYSSSNNSIIGNDIIENNFFGDGIFLRNSTSNRILRNNIANNYDGITFKESSNNNNLVGNNITASERWGIGLDFSSGNCLYHNNIINNTYQVASGASANVWDAGYSSGGNYWSDYNGTDNNQDGIGDTPYIISMSVTDADHYPLMGTFQSFNVSVYNRIPSQFEEVDIISNSTIGQVYLSWADDARNPPTNMDWFLLLSGFVGQNGTVGFCRITLPNDILNSTSYHAGTWTQWNNDNLTISKVLSSNGTHTTLYFTYEVPNPLPFPDFEIIIIPEFPSFLILAIFMIPALLAAIVYRKKHAKISRSPQSGCDFVDTEKEKG
jgi:parallel beta-helix repeat protein